jgi:hypothetical protein
VDFRFLRRSFVKRTKRAVNVAILAASLSTVRCGGDTGPGGDSSASDGGQGGAGSSSASGSGGFAGSGFGGFGGFGFPDAGSDPHDCPTQMPVDSSSCTGASTCRYPDGVCRCVRSDGHDASAREWNCFETMPPHDASTPPRDGGGGCPNYPAQEGDMCMNLGQRCAGSSQGTTCTCEPGDGNLQWHC